ncbi:MAG TPA: DUF6152 family protein [Bryobacteraceae bacterium]|jgi:hypothetical protein|nr:DUF6152 family protein [Bryobacteraceae bacterium]
MMKKILSVCACMLGLWIAVPAFAHHSMTGFDRAKTVTLNGTIKGFGWVNPHSWIEMEVPNSKGGADTWNIEMTAPGILAKAGWKSNTIKPGDKVSVAVHPLLTGEPGGLFVSVTLANGTVMMERGQPQPAAAPKQ